VLDEILPEAFAVVRTPAGGFGAARSRCGPSAEVEMIPFDVQLIGGWALHQGRIAEMATGEGKTLVATMPVYLNALAGGAFTS